MRARAARAVLVPSHGYVCLSCRLQSIGVEGRSTRRYQHTGSKDDDGSKDGPKTEPKTVEELDASVTSSRIRDIIRGFMGGQKTATQNKGTASSQEITQDVQRQNPIPPAAPLSSDDARQQKLQQQFASQRRKDLLEMQATNVRRVTSNDGGVIRKTESQPGETRNRPAYHKPRSARRQHKHDLAKKKLESVHTTMPADESKIVAAVAGQARDHAPINHAESNSQIDKVERDAAEVPSQSVPQPKELKAKEMKVEASDATGTTSDDLPVAAPNSWDQPEKPKVSPKKSKPKAPSKSSGSKKSPTQSGTKPTKEVKEVAPTEAERKAQLANRLELEVKKTVSTSRKVALEGQHDIMSKHAVKDGSTRIMRKVQSRSKDFGNKISDVEGFDSFQSAVGGKGTKIKTDIEKADATKLEILPVAVEQPHVPSLSYGLERVLFNPGVYQLQDPRSRVYNFDPYLQKIMPVADFDFTALKEYITSSRDESLKRIAKEHDKRYVGSTSSMTGVLAHFHFLLSQWRPINATMLSKTFPTHLTSFTELQRTPSAIFLRWKDGSYAIDADKQFANANVLSMLGKSMEKLLTLSTEDYERYRRSSAGQVTEDEQFAPESYHYSTMGDFLMRSQLDAHDPRLPGTGMFDLKTRAVVSIRMDVSNYEQGTGYQIKSRQGEWESYEREYYDMIRAAFLKYSMQVRMGRMDGIFVAFHNVERIFGFQYISLPEMDSTIHGQWDTSLGDQEFKLSLDLLNKALDKAIAKFPETSIRLHFETREAQTPFMYIFAEPVSEEQVAEVQSANDAKIREFERSILGLDRGEDSASEDTQEDDGKWENIQADVQKEMDKDEMSLDDPSPEQEVEEAEEANMEDSGRISEIRGIFEDGPLYANKRSAKAEGDVAATAAGSDDGAGESEDDKAEDEDIVDADEEGSENEEDLDEEVDEAEGDEVKGLVRVDGIKEVSEAHDAEEASSGEGLTEDSSEENQASDQDTMPTSEDESEATNDTDQPAEAEGKPNSAGDATGQANASGQTEPTPKPLSAKELKKKAKADYVPLVGAEQTAFKTVADQPFLDAIAKDIPLIDEAAENAPEILAMTLTLRNKVNGQYTLRPERLTEEDKWSMEYSLIEVPTQRRARALYEACQTRRKKKMHAPPVQEDAEMINLYIQNLRKMSQRGKDWRTEQDKKDSEKPVQMLGREIARRGGEGDLVNQESEA